MLSKGNPLALLEGRQMDSATMENGWFLKKLEIKLPYDPAAVPLLGIYSEESIIEKDTCTLLFTAALFTIALTWK